MSFARATRLLVALALLAAQQAALAHQIWHLAAGAAHSPTASIAGEDRGAPAPRELLCDLHTALATVLGALESAAPSVAIVATGEVPFDFRELPAAASPAPRPASRGPPSLL